MAKLTKDSLIDKIFGYVKDRIISGEWPPNTKIPGEIELSQTLGVSRMSLRMAIQKSNLLGLTETMVGDGTYTRDFSMRSYFKELYNSKILELDFKEINDFRMILEIGAIRLGIEKGITQETVDSLETTYERMRKAIDAKDIDLFGKMDLEFHKTVCRLCDNELMSMLYDAIEYTLVKVAATNVEKSVDVDGSYEHVLQFHNEMLEGIRKGDLDRCIRAELGSRARSYSLFYTGRKQ